MKIWLTMVVVLLLASRVSAQQWVCTGNSPATWSCTMTAPPLVSTTSATPFQLAAPLDVQKAILDALAQLHQDALANLTVEQSTNAQLTATGLTFSGAMTWLGKYVAPAAVTLIATLKATGKI